MHNTSYSLKVTYNIMETVHNRHSYIETNSDIYYFYIPVAYRLIIFQISKVI